MRIITFLAACLYAASPWNMTVPLYLPFLLRFLILNVAFPWLLVFALYVFLLILRVTFAFLIGDLMDFKVMLYFLTFLEFLKVFQNLLHFEKKSKYYSHFFFVKNHEICYSLIIENFFAVN